MDPRKTFICKDCGTVVNDAQRQWGAATPCPRCIRKGLEVSKNMRQLPACVSTDELQGTVIKRYYHRKCINEIQRQTMEDWIRVVIKQELLETIIPLVKGGICILGLETHMVDLQDGKDEEAKAIVMELNSSSWPQTDAAWAVVGTMTIVYSKLG